MATSPVDGITETPTVFVASCCPSFVAPFHSISYGHLVTLRQNLEYGLVNLYLNSLFLIPIILISFIFIHTYIYITVFPHICVSQTISYFAALFRFSFWVLFQVFLLFVDVSFSEMAIAFLLCAALHELDLEMVLNLGHFMRILSQKQTYRMVYPRILFICRVKQRNLDSREISLLGFWVTEFLPSKHGWCF